MSSLIRTLSSPKLWRPVMNLCVLPWISLCFQTLLTIFIATAGSFLMWGSPGLFSNLLPGIPSESRLIGMRIWLLALGFGYALAWFAYWGLVWSLGGSRKIPAFPVHVLAAWVPLLAIVYCENPVSNPYAMIPISQAEITFKLSLLLMAAALFPFYSAAVYGLVIACKPVRVRRTVRLLAVWAVFAAAAYLLLPVCWRLAVEGYPGIAGFPTY